MQVDTESADTLNLERRINNVRIAIYPARMRWKGREYRFFDVDPVERTLGERLHTAINTNRRRSPGDEQQIAAPAPREEPQPTLEARHVAGSRQRATGRVKLENQTVDVVVIRHHLLTSLEVPWPAFYLDCSA